MTKVGTCHLCHEKKPLMKSHIIPKFMTKKITNTTPRRIYQIDKTLNLSQDTYKIPMLCHDCEEKFSVLEKYFQFNFEKNKYTKNVHYTNKLYRFVLSIFWRCMEYRLLTIEIEEKNKYDKVLKIRHNIREYLNNDNNSSDYEVYMFRLTSSKNINFNILTSKRKLGTITYSIYANFSQDTNEKLDCSKDSATNYSLTLKSPIPIEEFPFTYFNILNYEENRIFFLVIESYIFILNLSHSALPFSDKSIIKRESGIWTDETNFPSIINEYLNNYGETVNNNIKCTKRDLLLLYSCLICRGIVTGIPKEICKLDD